MIIPWELLGVCHLPLETDDVGARCAIKTRHLNPEPPTCRGLSKRPLKGLFSELSSENKQIPSDRAQRGSGKGPSWGAKALRTRELHCLEVGKTIRESGILELMVTLSCNSRRDQRPNFRARGPLQSCPVPPGMLFLLGFCGRALPLISPVYRL